MDSIDAPKSAQLDQDQPAIVEEPVQDLQIDLIEEEKVGGVEIE